MSWEVIIAIIGAVGGATGIVELIKFWVNRHATKRSNEAEANNKWFGMYEHQLDRMNTQIEFKDRRIEDLNAELAEKETRYIEQTQRLRESQDREYESQMEIRRLNKENQRLSEQVTSLTQEIGELKLFIEEQQCRKLACPFRRPLNRHTREVLAELGLEIDADELPKEDPESLKN